MEINEQGFNDQSKIYFITSLPGNVTSNTELPKALQLFLDSFGHLRGIYRREMSDATQKHLPSSWMDRLSPRLIRLIARQGRKPMTHAKLSEISGLCNDAICRISKLEKWDTVTVSARAQFMMACGVDRKNFWRHVEFLKRQFSNDRIMPPFIHTGCFTKLSRNPGADGARKKFYMNQYPEIRALSVLWSEKK